MSPTLIYIHGQGGSPEEAEHYRGKHSKKYILTT